MLVQRAPAGPRSLKLKNLIITKVNFRTPLTGWQQKGEQILINKPLNMEFPTKNTDPC